MQVKQQANAAWQFLGQYSGEAARLHLALFYIYGSYYEWPKRLAGQQTHQTSQDRKPKHLYHFGALHMCMFMCKTQHHAWRSRACSEHGIGRAGLNTGLCHAGVRYAFIGKTVDQRASYRVLGTLLFTQLAITAGIGAVDALSKSLSPQLQQHLGGGAARDKHGHAVVLQVIAELWFDECCSVIEILCSPGAFTRHARWPFTVGSRS